MQRFSYPLIKARRKRCEIRNRIPGARERRAWNAERKLCTKPRLAINSRLRNCGVVKLSHWRTSSAEAAPMIEPLETGRVSPGWSLRQRLL
jgi:hypothetical protein